MSEGTFFRLNLRLEGEERAGDNDEEERVRLSVELSFVAGSVGLWF
jgi:hypothetical protein